MRPYAKYRYEVNDYVSVKKDIHKYASNDVYHSAEKGRVGKITERFTGSISDTRYYRISLGGDKESVWIAEHELDNIDPLADWEKQLINKDWDKVKTNKFEVGDKVTHDSIGDGIGIVIEAKGKELYGVSWGSRGIQQNHESFMTLVPEKQIKADDPRLEQFWGYAASAAKNAGFCSEFDRIANDLGRPKPKRVKTTVRIVQPVTIEIEVEHDEGATPDWKEAWNQTGNPGAIVERAARQGRFIRWQAALETNQEDF